MSINENDVESGAFFINHSNPPQLRKVTAVVKDEKGNKRVEYISKSAVIPGRDFNPGHTKSNPPLMNTFIADCERRLTSEEVQELLISGVLCEDEI